MTEHVFLSHSQRDAALLDRFVKCFGLVPGIAAQVYEYDARSGRIPGDRATADVIKEGIQNARAVFVLIGPNVVANPGTNNWIAFEIGTAHAANPPVPIWVFESLSQKVDFRVPELDRHVLFDASPDDRHEAGSQEFWDWLRAVLEGLTKSWPFDAPSFQVLASGLGTISESSHRPIEYDVSCTSCKVKFRGHYPRLVEKPSCPSCRQEKLKLDSAVF